MESGTRSPSAHLVSGELRRRAPSRPRLFRSRAQAPACWIPHCAEQREPGDRFHAAANDGYSLGRASLPHLLTGSPSLPNLAVGADPQQLVGTQTRKSFVKSLNERECGFRSRAGIELCSWHSTSGSVPDQEHFFRSLGGGTVRDLRARKGTPR